MKKTVFIDGQHGTTGLKIHERLQHRDDIEVVEIDSEKRKNASARKELANSVDFLILCLPDYEAQKAASMVNNPHVRVLDGSSAHRTALGWTYGFPEWNLQQQELIARASRVSVPGCYATGFVACMHPLVRTGIVPSDYPVTAHSVTGYSGGGRKMIEEYQAGGKGDEICCRPKNLDLSHKHLPEMQKYGLLDNRPIFSQASRDI